MSKREIEPSHDGEEPYTKAELKAWDLCSQIGDHLIGLIEKGYWVFQNEEKLLNLQWEEYELTTVHTDKDNQSKCTFVILDRSIVEGTTDPKECAKEFKAWFTQMRPSSQGEIRFTPK